MKKAVFNLGLYLEALRQTRTITIVTTIISSLINAFTIIAVWVNLIDQKNWAVSHGEVFVKQTFSGLAACPALILIGLLLVPAITCELYKFQNHRNTSDFYHALPHTRLCLFLSYQAAILTQMTVSILTCVLFSVILCAMASGHLILVVSPLLLYALFTSAIGIFFSAAVAIAMAITGTQFTNGILTLIITFLPRTLLLLFYLILLNVLPNVIAGHFMPFADPSLNAFTGLIFCLPGVTSVNTLELLVHLPSIFYTFALGILYTVLAAWFFHRRKSESAGFSAPNKILQSVYRIIVGTAITLIPTALLYNAIQNGELGDLFPYVFFWIFGIIAYFLYELITTKKWKNLIKCAPGLAIVLAANLFFVGMIHTAFTIELNFTPDAEQVKAVSIVGTKNEYDEQITEFQEYAALRSEHIEITDPAMIRLITDSLKQNVTDFKTMSRNEFYDKYVFARPYSDPEKGETPEEVTLYEAISFRIETATGVNYRKVWIPFDYKAEILNALEANEEYKKIWTTIPDMLFGSATVYSNSLWSVDSSSITDDQLSEIHASLREEIKACDFNSWYNALQTQEPLFYIRYSFLDGMNIGNIRVPILLSETPETAKLVLSMMGSNTEAFMQLLTKIRTALEETDLEKDFDYSIYSELMIPGDGFTETYSFGFDSITDQRIDFLLENAGTIAEITSNSPIIVILVDFYPYDKYEYESGGILLPLTLPKEELKELLGIDGN